MSPPTLERMSVRQAPDARSLRADTLTAALLALFGCVMVALSALTGMQFTDMPIWQPMLFAVLLVGGVGGAHGGRRARAAGATHPGAATSRQPTARA